MMDCDKLTNYEQMKILLNQIFGKEMPLRGCHIGCFQGEMEVALLDEFPNLSVVGIDPLGSYYKWLEWPNGKKDFVLTPIDLAVLRQRHDLWNRFDFKMCRSDAASKEIEKENILFDYVYIDGDHHYEQVQRDIVNYYPFIKETGIMAGDDYRPKSCYKEITSETLGPQVKQAVDELLPNNLHIEDAGTWWIYKKDILWSSARSTIN